MGRPRAVGCHIYAGGFTVGVSELFDIVGQWEELDAGARTFELNFPDVPHPLNKVDWPAADWINRVDLVYGNPPCAPWSPAGGHLGMADPRLRFTDSVMEVGLALRAPVVIVESVPRAWSANGGRSFYTDWATRYTESGYGVTVLLTNSVLHGAPQTRPRFHFIAHRFELRPVMPTVGPGDIRTVRDAIGDIEDRLGELPNHTARVLAEPGQNVMRRMGEGEGWWTGMQRCIADGVPYTKSRFITGRLTYDAPSGTVVDVDCLVHPARDRMLTQREGARLCTYPDDFIFSGTPRPRMADVTQAVLPLMGRYLGGLALESIRGRVPVRFNEVVVVDWRRAAKPFYASRFAAMRTEEECVETGSGD